MRHKRAAQLADGSGWHYVDGGHPVGYCNSHAPHPTEADARECYGRWLREETIRLDVGRIGWTSCDARPDGQRCPNPTQRYATWGNDGYGLVPLCPEHMTAEHVIERGQLAGPAGDSWVS